nr:MAG TPA: Protein C [Inoviridae sp.]
MNRFAALFAALMLCASLCLPCFASNNASSQKWVIIEQKQFANEMGTQSTYFHVSPYVNGELYRTRFITESSSIKSTVSDDYYDWWSLPVNYPDWWRAPVPLGSRSYIQIDSPRVVEWGHTSGSSITTGETLSGTLEFLLVNPDYGFSVSRSYTSSAMTLSQDVLLYPVDTMSAVETTSGSTFSRSLANGIRFPNISSNLNQSGTQAIESFSQVIMGFNDFFSVSNETLNFSLRDMPVLYNASSDSLILFVSYPSWHTPDVPGKYRLEASAVVSYWIDANKLPPGLSVGDEFPANNDAFENLREELLKQFPEASDNVETGKATIEGWNDTETVDTDVASTSISVLNALFQNLGGFLFIVSLMVFGAVLLRMLIRKAVDG